MPMKKSVSIILSVLVLLAASLAYFSYAGAGAYAADGTSTDAVTKFISSESDFMDLMLDCGMNATEGNTYILTTDIYLSRYYAAGGGSLGRGAVFEGTLDGRGHAIVGVRISDGNVQNAFFKEISPSATVKNLKLIDAEVSGSDVAALAVFNYGVVENVSVTGAVKGLTAAGIAVYNFGAIRDCVTAVNLSGSDGCRDSKRTRSRLSYPRRIYRRGICSAVRNRRFLRTERAKRRDIRYRRQRDRA